MKINQGKNTFLDGKAQKDIIGVNKEREKQRMEHKTTEAKRRAIYRYDDKFERVNCRLKKETKERIKRLGYKSANDFIKLAVAEKLEKEARYG